MIRTANTGRFMVVALIAIPLLFFAANSRSADHQSHKHGGFALPSSLPFEKVEEASPIGGMRPVRAGKDLAQRAWGKVERAEAADTCTATVCPFEVQRLFVDDDGIFPNNPQFPLLLYKSAFSGSSSDGEHLITSGVKWTPPWAWGVFPYHHYHTTAWELLLCVRGSADVQIGGENGPTVNISRGDLALIPPGVAHKEMSSEGGFTLLGSYPTERWTGSIDTVTGQPTEEQRRNIADCYVPPKDPLFGLEIEKLCQ
uniref:Cupin type-2 domain-containing protein n=1 Tax=Odontella aurita TaxID=265563 RepID=A0A7S4NFK5_9STRA|mmetsp:Transcript_62437/g.184710  ORF Transcript_62437/g.184710 Transcript_62437/m.184710 type:complete len:256 (+) Transcript_62437:67-834(+)